MVLDRIFVFKAINIGVLLAAVASCLFISFRAQGQFAGNTFFIAPTINEGRYFFSLNDIEEFRVKTNADRVAFKNLSTSGVSALNISVHSRVVQTNSDYFELNNVSFSSGGGWLLSMENDNVAVINESLAYKLFGSLDVVDMNLAISDKTYTIIGVIQHGDVSQVNPTVYIPLNPEYEDKVISSIYAQFVSYDFLTTHNAISNYLSDTGRNNRDYYILSLCRYVENIELKSRLLLFILGVYAMVIIVINCIKLLRGNPLNKKTLLKFAVLLPLIALGVVILIRTISFEFWIPHGSGSRINDIVATITNNGVLPSNEYLGYGLQTLVRLNSYANITLIVGCVALLNFVFVHKASYVLVSAKPLFKSNTNKPKE